MTLCVRAGFHGGRQYQQRVSRVSMVRTAKVQVTVSSQDHEESNKCLCMKARVCRYCFSSHYSPAASLQDLFFEVADVFHRGSLPLSTLAQRKARWGALPISRGAFCFSVRFYL